MEYRMSDDLKERAKELISGYISEHDSDLILYSGGINDSDLESLNQLVLNKADHGRKLTLFLTTFGGDAHAAYRTARVLQRRDNEIRIVIPGPCKSAGTLLALSGTELVFGDSGELGPLDVQLLQPEDIFRRSSALDTLGAFESVQNRTFSAFEHFMLNIVVKSSGNISTKMACEVSSQLAGALFQPIAAQIDPYRLGEVERALAIANAYGLRLIQKSGNLTKHGLIELLNNYPSHGFVIDEKEATTLFNRVRHCNTEELQISEFLGDLVRNPQDPKILIDFEEFFNQEEDHESHKTDAIGTSTKNHEAGQQVSRPREVTPEAK